MQTDKAKFAGLDMTGIDMDRIPAHVAVIMDGNGRWARERGRDRSEGHTAGVESVRAITRFASDLGVKHLTLYAFSTENWNRPEAEVAGLMHLIGWAIRRETPDLKQNNVRIKVIGDKGRLPEAVRADLEYGENETDACTGMQLNLCISYSSRSELVDAVRRIALDSAAGKLQPGDIDERMVESRLFTASIPDPDLLIRTGGELRISNFLLWQIAYSELYFSPVLWPDFRQVQFIEAIAAYQNRERRFGKTSDQVKQQQNNDPIHI